MSLLPMKQTSAWFPIACSITALGLVLGHYAVFGFIQQQNEGTPAHVFQMLLVVQLPVVAYFIIRYVPRRPRAALFTLLLQALAAVGAIATVVFLGQR